MIVRQEKYDNLTWKSYILRSENLPGNENNFAIDSSTGVIDKVFDLSAFISPTNSLYSALLSFSLTYKIKIKKIKVLFLLEIRHFPNNSSWPVDASTSLYIWSFRAPTGTRERNYLSQESRASTLHFAPTCATWSIPHDNLFLFRFLPT